MALPSEHEVSNTLNRLRQESYLPVADLSVTCWRTKEPVPFAEREKGEKRSLKPGDKWGDLFDCAWFHFTGRVPEQAAGKPVVLLIDVNGEACVVDGQGNPRLGLTAMKSSFDISLGGPGKRVVPFADPAKGGEEIDLWADAGCNDLFGVLIENGTLREARIAVVRPETRALYYDVEVLGDLMRQLPETSARRHQIGAALREAFRLLQPITEDSVRDARRQLSGELAKRNGDPSLTVSAIGHSHIDLAWLWPVRETIRKGARTFATALRVMERYPDYRFGASQPQLYRWMKDHYPSVYEEVKQRIAEGRWEVQGAMWVEADTNLTSGESLVRQMLYGKRFFRAEFGLDMKTLWLPDVFGYSGALPQLIKKSGVDYFMTIKISWNQVNRFPHHTFWWQGIDGTRVLAHMPPEGTYNSAALPSSVARIERDYQQKALSDSALLLFGIGDGGGGPGEEHLERLARMKDLQGLPPVVQQPAAVFFEELALSAETYPVWEGELYLEKHQGTYTSQGRSKRANRKLEIALHEAEWLSATASWLTGFAYPSERLEAIWKEALLYQFHDILPGSSITRVYEESLVRYDALLEQTAQLAAQATASLVDKIDTAGLKQPMVVTNGLSWARTEFVPIGDEWVEATVPALGYRVIDVAQTRPAFNAPVASSKHLENELLRVEFNADGSLASIFDKRQKRQVLAPGQAGNRLMMYRDGGDAWDFAMDYDEQVPEPAELQSAEPRVEGPKAILRHVFRCGDSTLTQDVILTAGRARLDFRTQVDWRENGRMLRTSFPVAVRANEATCEIQFGSLRRPTHMNTSWDRAKHEICAQKWVDISDRGVGVALLNDCKYGHKVHGNVLDLNLLRSPSGPDPKADRAEHDFTYALFPHPGDHVAGGVAQEAYALNHPLQMTKLSSHLGTLPPVSSLLQIDAPSVICETVKKAEEGEDLILRLYESSGASTRATLALGTEVKSVALVNLLEENAQPLSLSQGRVALDFTPYEIHTLRLSRQS